jgi:F-type H+-transporting ATPase subunit b
MPQLDSTYYASSVFWFLVSFALLFVFIRTWVSPRLESLSESRKHRIESKLAEISSLRGSIDLMEKEYKCRVHAAKEQAALSLRSALDEFEKQRAECLEEVEEQCREELEKELRELQKKRDYLVINLEKLSGSLSEEIISKLAG